MLHENSVQTVRVIDSAVNCPTLPIIEGKGSARAVIWPGTGARYRTVHLLELAGGDRTIDFKHNSDAVYYVAKGRGEIVDLIKDRRLSIEEGSMVHIDGGDAYRFETEYGMKIIGGPCPADFSLYSNITLAESD